MVSEVVAELRRKHVVLGENRGIQVLSCDKRHDPLSDDVWDEILEYPVHSDIPILLREISRLRRENRLLTLSRGVTGTVVGLD